MKKITNLLLAASVIAFSASCNKEIDQVVPNQTAKSTVLTAHVDNGSNTRTSLNDVNVIWSANDAIVAFAGTTSYTSTNTEVKNDGLTAKFTFDGEINPTYAFYPAAGASIDENGVISSTIPTEQEAAQGTFANGASLAIAKVGNVNDIHFKNVGALVAFKINATEHNIVSMTLYGTETSGKGMTGQVAVSIASNEVTTQCSGEDHVTVSGVLSVGKLYYAVIAPGTYSDVKIVFTDNEGKTATYIKDDNLVVNRNDHLILGGFSPDSRWKVETKYYTKVTSTANLTSGQYLIVYEGESLAFNGGLNTLDATLNTINVKINDGTIESNSTTDAAIFYIDITAGTIKSASGSYIGRSGDSNGLNSSTTEAYTNTISIDGDGNAVVVSSGGAYLRYNATSGQDRFRYFKSSTYTSQKAIALYALETTARTPAELSFASSTAEAFVGQTGFTGPQLTKNPADISVTWESDATDVAYIKPDGSLIDLKKAGTAKITARFAGNAEYAPATAYYTLTVKPAYTITLQDVTDGKVFVGAAISSNVKFKVTSSYAWTSSVFFESDYNSSFTVSPTQGGTGEVEVTVTSSIANATNAARKLGSITISNEGASQTVEVWQKAPGTDYDLNNESNVELVNYGDANAIKARVIIGGTEYLALKAGTGDVAGVAKVKIPAGTTVLHIHIAGWNNEDVKVGITGASCSPNSDTVFSDAGIKINSPFTLSGEPKTYYKKISLQNITDETFITFTATEGHRFVLWGVNAE